MAHLNERQSKLKRQLQMEKENYALIQIQLWN